MPLHFKKIDLLAGALLGGCLFIASPEVRAAETAISSTHLNSEFALVPAGDSLYNDFTAIQEAGWTTLPVSSELSMTRYEMALETAKALISVRAKQRVDVRWKDSASPAALRSLRSLCLSLSAELARFDVDSRKAAADIDGWMQNGSSDTPAFSGRRQVERPVAEVPTSGLPLSQRLRVFGAAASLDRAERDPLTGRNLGSSGASLHLARTSSTAPSSLGATFSVNQWISLRGGVSRRATSNSLASSLFGDSSYAVSGDERSFGGGVDIAVRPGVLLRGDVSKFESRGSGFTSFGQSSGTRFDTTVELAGWQNRVALSAQLSRLVPEDSYALASTAAQFNLGVDLSRQVSLKLLYRQLFESPQNGAGSRVIAGGFDISF